MSTIKEVIRTSGDVRRTLAQTMVDIRCGEISVDKGLAIAALAKEITASIQAEVNVVKVKDSVLRSGGDMGKITHLGQMVIEDSGAVPTLSGS